MTIQEATIPAVRPPEATIPAAIIPAVTIQEATIPAAIIPAVIIQEAETKQAEMKAAQKEQVNLQPRTLPMLRNSLRDDY